MHGTVKTYLVACSQLSQETLRPYQAFVSHTVQQKTRVPDVKCNYDILYAVGPAPCDKNCRSEHKTFFPLFSFSARVWGQEYVVSSSFPYFKMKKNEGGNNKETGCLMQLASSTKVNHATRLTTMIAQLNCFYTVHDLILYLPPHVAAPPQPSHTLFSPPTHVAFPPHIHP